MPPRPPEPWPRPVPGARGCHGRSPPGGHDADSALPKRGTPPPYAPLCSPGGPLSDDTRTFRSETAVSGEDLHQTEREDDVASLRPSEQIHSVSVIKTIVDSEKYYTLVTSIEYLRRNKAKILHHDILRELRRY